MFGTTDWELVPHADHTQAEVDGWVGRVFKPTICFDKAEI